MPYYQDKEGWWYGPAGNVEGRIEGTLFRLQWDESGYSWLGVKRYRSISGAVRRMRAVCASLRGIDLLPTQDYARVESAVVKGVLWRLGITNAVLEGLMRELLICEINFNEAWVIPIGRVDCKASCQRIGREKP